jgi:hypothetical protein
VSQLIGNLDINQQHMLMSQLAHSNFKFGTHKRDGEQRHVAFAIEQSKGSLLKKQNTDMSS